MENKNNRKTKLILGMIIAIIIVLLVGIIYQFIYIKKLERQIESSNNSSYEYVINLSNHRYLCNNY